MRSPVYPEQAGTATSQHMAHGGRIGGSRGTPARQRSSQIADPGRNLRRPAPPSPLLCQELGESRGNDRRRRTSVVLSTSGSASMPPRCRCPGVWSCAGCRNSIWSACMMRRRSPRALRTSRSVCPTASIGATRRRDPFRSDRLAGQAPTRRCGSGAHDSAQGSSATPPAVLRGSAKRTGCLARPGGPRRQSTADRAGRAPRRRACSGCTR